MNDLEIRRASRANLPAIAALIGELNTHPEHRCLHCDEDAVTVMASIEQLAEPAEHAFVVAVSDSGLAGVLGCDSDPERGRGWLWGPFINAGDWERVADEMMTELLKRLPAGLRQLDSFMDLRNQCGVDFYLRHDFQARGITHVYYAECPTAPVAVDDPCPELADADAHAFVALHDSTFPGTYLPGTRILGKLDADNPVFTHHEGGWKVPGLLVRIAK